MSYQIAIDGPAGVGKSTIAKILSEKLSYIYVDTGALYRALGVFFSGLGLSAEDEKGISESLSDVRVSIEYQDGVQHVFVNGEDVTGLLRTKEASHMASVTSQYQKVRERLLGIQRELAETYNVIMDGRDIGTVILPEATLKIFLTADAAVRAKRRYLQLLEQNALDGQTIESIEKDIIERDKRDSERAIAPLKQADDAVLIDTSYLTISEVEEKITELLKERIS